MSTSPQTHFRGEATEDYESVLWNLSVVEGIRKTQAAGEKALDPAPEP